MSMDSSYSRVNLSHLHLPPGTRSRASFVDSIGRRAQYLRKQGRILYFVFKHSRTRWYGRLIAICAAAYVFSPIQLIPNFIPVIGCLDDVLVILLAARMVQRITPPDVLAKCRELADDAEARRKEEFRWAVLAPVLLAVVWFLTAIAVTALVATYIYF
jgi:uncharacterized membrane protein YkvA (DUF1232 family)